MKKVTIALLSLLAMIACMFAISACGGSCGGNEDQTETPHVHTFGEYVVSKAATCTVDGEEQATCTDCGEVDVRIIPATGHKWGDASTVEPDCLNEGYTWRKCSACQETEKSAIVPALGHKWNIAAATCTQGQVCEREGCEATGAPAHGHVYDEGTIVPGDEVTCTQDGYKTYVCIECGDPDATIREKYATKTGHVFNSQALPQEVVQGCEHILTLQCTSCQQDIEVSRTAVHKYKGTIETPATCSANGVKKFTCTECGDNYTEEYSDSNAHTWGAGAKEGNITTYTCTHDSTHQRKTVASTETAAQVQANDLKEAGELELFGTSITLDESAKGVLEGKTSVSVSAGTLDNEQKNQALEALGADASRIGDNEIYNFTMEADDEPVTNFGGKVTIKIPYELQADDDPELIVIWYINGDTLTPMKAVYTVIDGQGYAVFETEHFSYYTVTRMTPAERCEIYGHHNVTRDVQATCITNGSHLVMCTRCGAVSEKEIIPATGHTWTETTIDATCTTDGSLTRECSVCDITLTTTLFATGHAWELIEEKSVEATCLKSGKSHYECANCDEEYEVTEAQKAHRWVTTVIAPTCTLSGYTQKVCSNCQTETRSDYVAALGHDMVTTVVAPTCTTIGYTTHECSRCDYREDNTDIVEALGHDMVKGVCSRCGEGCKHDWQQSAVVAATCTEKGYTELKCSKCGLTKTENETAALGHSFDFNECVRCHIPNPELVNYYMNMLKELEVNHLAIRVTDVSFSYDCVAYDKDDNVSEDESEKMMEVQLKNIAEVMLSIDSGRLFGAGKGSALITQYDHGQPETFTEDVSMIIDDKMVYVIVESPEEFDGGVMYEVLDLDALLGSFVTYDQIMEYITWVEESAIDIAANLADVNSETITAVLKTVIGILFDEPASTTDGYKYTLKPEAIAEMSENIGEMTAQEFIDNYTEDGFFDKTVGDITELLGKNVIDLFWDIVDNNIDYDELCNAINALMEIYTGDEFDADAVISEYLEDGGPMDVTVAQAVAGKMEGMVDSEGNEKITDMVSQIADSMKEATIIELLGSRGTRVTSVLDYAAEVAANGFAASFTTDKSGKVLTFDAEATDAVLEIGGYGTDQGTYVYQLTLSGKLSIVFGAVINVDYEKQVNDKINQALRLPKNASLNGTLLETGSYYPRFVEVRTDSLGNIVTATSYTTVSLNTGYGSGREMYMGEMRNYIDLVYTLSAQTLTAANGFNYGITGDICGGYRYFSLFGTASVRYLTRSMRTYYDLEGNVLGEVKLQADKYMSGEQTAQGYVSFYYNIETNVMRLDNPHHYVEDTEKSVVPQKCEEVGYKYMVCELCGNVEKQYYSKNHEHTVREGKLLVEGGTCEDGVIMSTRCLDCGKVLHSYETYDHETIGEEIDISELGSICGGYITYYHCTCGEQASISQYGTGCDLRPDPNTSTGNETHYVCSVTDCPFEFTATRRNPVYQQSKCRDLQETIYKFGTNTENPIERVGKEYSVHHVYVQDPSNTEDYNVVGNDGGLLTITDKEINYRSCSVCHLKWGSKRIYTRYYSADNQEQATDETKVKEVTETEEIDSYSSGETNKHTYSSTRNYSGGKLASEEFTRTEEYTRGTKVLNSSESSGSVVYDSYLRKDNQVGRFLSQYCSDANWANYLGNQMYEAYLGEYTYQNTQYYEDGSYEESYATVEYTIKDSECVYDLNMSRQSTYYDEEGEPYERTPVNVFFEDITNHAEPERVSVSEATCTQYETYTINCNKCGDEGTEVLWDWNLGHDYRYDDVSGRMVCTKCGLENDKSVDGPIVLEDLSQNQKYAQQGYIVIGYNYNVRDWRFEEIYNGLFHNHFHPFGFMVAVTLIGEDGDTQFILDGVDPIVSDMYDTESLIKISLSEIAAAGEQYQGQLGSNFSIMISLVFNDASGLACNITLDPTEFSING